MILVADKFGRFLHVRRQIFVGRFYWRTKLANIIDRLTAPIESSYWSSKTDVVDADDLGARKHRDRELDSSQ